MTGIQNTLANHKIDLALPRQNRQQQRFFAHSEADRGNDAHFDYMFPAFLHFDVDVCLDVLGAVLVLFSVLTSAYIRISQIVTVTLLHWRNNRDVFVLR